MFDHFQTKEQKEEEFERKLKQLDIEEESLSLETGKLFDSLSITPEQIEDFFNQSDYISKEKKQELESIRQTLEEKLKQELDNVRNPKKAEEDYKKRNLPPNALFCK